MLFRSEENLIERHLFDNRESSVSDVCSEEKLLLGDGISKMSSSEILLNLRDRDVEVKVTDVMEHQDYDKNQDVIGCILI